MAYYIPTHFHLYELVDPGSFGIHGNALWRVFDPRILKGADVLRERYGRLIVNDWYWSGQCQWSGFRPPLCSVGADLSQHRFGRGLDLHPEEVTPEEIRQDLITHPEIVRVDGIWLITALEMGVGWVHGDCRNHDVDRHGFKLFGTS